MERTVKVGVMPGRVNEFVVDSSTSIQELLNLAEVNPSGYEVKVDGSKTTDFSAQIGTGNLVLLTKQVKGNTEKTVKVGVMPGRVNEFVVDSSTSIEDLLVLADVNSSGYEVKVDGNKVTDFSQQIGTGNLVLLTKQVKGNAEKTVKVGVMPGRVNEFVVDSSTTIQELLQLADVKPDGYEVKVDGNKTTDFSQPIGSGNLVLLTKQVKGN